MKTNNHEVIFAIVNAGFAEEVMDVARENGARGGTILNARGVAGQEAAAFSLPVSDVAGLVKEPEESEEM